MEYEEELVKDIYDPVGLTDDVLRFVKYNANKALMNLGYEPFYDLDEKSVNPVVINGLNTRTKTMDVFSQKGNGYQLMESQSLNDDSFHFDGKRTALLGRGDTTLGHKHEAVDALDSMRNNSISDLTENDPDVLHGSTEDVIRKVVYGTLSQLDYATIDAVKQADIKFASQMFTLLKEYYGDDLTKEIVGQFLDNTDDMAYDLAYIYSNNNTDTKLHDIGEFFAEYFEDGDNIGNEGLHNLIKQAVGLED